MKDLLYRVASSRSFTTSLSILAVAIAAFVALQLLFVQPALAGWGNLCCKIGTTGCPSTGATFVSTTSTNHYCEGSSPAVCNSTSYRLEKNLVNNVLVNKACYSTVVPPNDSTSFTLSGPLTVCQFYRPDLKDVQAIVDSSAFQNENAGPGPHVVNIGGQVVCGIPDTDGVLRNYARFDAAITHGCVFRKVEGNIITYEQHFTDLDADNLCPDGVTSPVSGSFTGIAGSGVGDITTMLTYCQGGNPDSVPPVPATGPEKCLLFAGITADVNESFFDRRVCPKDPSAGRTVDGQIFAFTEKFVSSTKGFDPGKVSSCSCQSDLDGGNVECGQGNTGEPIKSTAAGATECEVDWANAGNPDKDTLDLNGNNQINGAIFDSLACLVDEIDKNTLRVCNNVIPRQIKIGTAQGKRALSFQFSEPDCVKSLQVSVPLVEGDTINILATGAFKNGARFVGWDDVVVVK